MTADDSREQAIEQASDVMYEFANGGLYDPMGLAGALESAGLLAGTANTTEGNAVDWAVGAIERAKELTAEVAKLRASFEAERRAGLAARLESRKLRAERDRADGWLNEAVAAAEEQTKRADLAVADLAALRDKVRALADDYDMRDGTHNHVVADLRELINGGRS